MSDDFQISSFFIRYSISGFIGFLSGYDHNELRNYFSIDWKNNGIHSCLSFIIDVDGDAIIQNSSGSSERKKHSHAICMNSALGILILCISLYRQNVHIMVLFW